ncbi:MAG: serine protease [Bdellovibrio sp.]|nr:serine protease [Bdellovibrio sp.]
MKRFLLLSAMIFLTVSAFAKDKIVGGVDINSPGYFVSLVDSSLRDDNSIEYYPVCGGTLIHKDGVYVVLTAAHCVENLTTKLFVTMKASLSSEINRDTLVPIKAIVSHPSYDKNLIINDLALLILDETSPLLQNPAITIIPIHADATEFSGRELTSIGFGNVSSYGDLYLDQMQSVVLNEVLIEECRKGGVDYQTVDQKQICAGNKRQGKRDTCFGDSGGPLILQTPTGPEQIGIVSWGMDCAQSETAGVYTRPSAFSAWIKQQIDLFTPNSVRIYTAQDMKTFSNAYCYSHNHTASDNTEEDGYMKEMQALFLLDNANYSVTTQLPDPNDMRLPLDACTFNLPNGESVSRSVSLKNNNDESGYDFEHIIKMGEKIFSSSSPLKMEYKISCVGLDKTDGLIASVNEDHSISIQIPLTPADRDVVRYQSYKSHGELLKTLPAGHKEIQSCGFNESEVKFYSSADDKRFFAQLTGPVFSHSYNKFYQLSLVPLRDEVQQILISIAPDKDNPLSGTMTFTNQTKVDVYSWQLECENLRFAISPQTELKNHSEKFLVFRSSIGSIPKKQSITVKATFDQDLRQQGTEEINCTINRQESPLEIIL